MTCQGRGSYQQARPGQGNPQDAGCLGQSQADGNAGLPWRRSTKGPGSPTHREPRGSGLSPRNCGRGQSRTRRGRVTHVGRRNLGQNPRVRSPGCRPIWGWIGAPAGAGALVRRGPQVGRELRYALGRAPIYPNPASRLPRPDPHPRALRPWLRPPALGPAPSFSPHSPRPLQALATPTSPSTPALSLQHRPLAPPSAPPLPGPLRPRRAGAGRCAPFETMAPGGRVVLCEEKIREKSGLAPHCDLGARQAAGGGRRAALAEGASFPPPCRRTGQARGAERDRSVPSRPRPEGRARGAQSGAGRRWG